MLDASASSSADGSSPSASKTMLTGGRFPAARIACRHLAGARVQSFTLRDRGHGTPEVRAPWRSDAATSCGYQHISSAVIPAFSGDAPYMSYTLVLP